MQDH
jgi:hypothetical protein